MPPMDLQNFYPKNYRTYLTEVFENKCLRNSSYSLRAFARDLGIGASTLTEVLAGKYGLSQTMAHQVAKHLNLSKSQTDHFLDLIAFEHARTAAVKKSAGERVRARLKTGSQSIALDGFKVISDWYHFALLELFAIRSDANNDKWFAERLGVSELTVTEAIARLERLGMIERQAKRWRVTEDFSGVGNDTPSDVIRKYHRQILEKALDALMSQHTEERENSSTVFAIERKDLPEAKKKLREFRREFAGLMSKSPNKDDVFCLSMQFFSLLKSTKS